MKTSLKQRLTMRAWRQRNREHVHATSRRYDAAHQSERRRYWREYYLAHREEILAFMKLRREALKGSL